MNCDLIARWYRWMEYVSFGGALHRRRCHFLPELRGKRVLLLGDGDGRFLAEFSRRYPETDVDSVDCSAAMLRLAEQRTRGNAHVRFHQRDVRTEPIPGDAYDLIITHFFLDCFTLEEIGPIVEKISATAAPDARWVISEFSEPSNGWRRLRARFWIHFLYFCFALLTGLEAHQLPDYSVELRKQGFIRKQRDEASQGLLASELWQRS